MRRGSLVLRPTAALGRPFACSRTTVNSLLHTAAPEQAIEGVLIQNDQVALIEPNESHGIFRGYQNFRRMRPSINAHMEALP